MQGKRSRTREAFVECRIGVYGIKNSNGKDGKTDLGGLGRGRGGIQKKKTMVIWSFEADLKITGRDNHIN